MHTHAHTRTHTHTYPHPQNKIKRNSPPPKNTSAMNTTILVSNKLSYDTSIRERLRGIKMSNFENAMHDIYYYWACEGGEDAHGIAGSTISLSSSIPVFIQQSSYLLSHLLDSMYQLIAISGEEEEEEAAISGSETVEEDDSNTQRSDISKYLGGLTLDKSRKWSSLSERWITLAKKTVRLPNSEDINALISGVKPRLLSDYTFCLRVLDLVNAQMHSVRKGAKERDGISDGIIRRDWIFRLILSQSLKPGWKLLSYLESAVETTGDDAMTIPIKECLKLLVRTIKLQLTTRCNLSNANTIGEFETSGGESINGDIIPFFEKRYEEDTRLESLAHEETPLSPMAELMRSFVFTQDYLHNSSELFISKRRNSGKGEEMGTIHSLTEGREFTFEFSVADPIDNVEHRIVCRSLDVDINDPMRSLYHTSISQYGTRNRSPTMEEILTKRRGHNNGISFNTMMLRRHVVALLNRDYADVNGAYRELIELEYDMWKFGNSNVIEPWIEKYWNTAIPSVLHCHRKKVRKNVENEMRYGIALSRTEAMQMARRDRYSMRESRDKLPHASNRELWNTRVQVAYRLVEQQCLKTDRIYVERVEIERECVKSTDKDKENSKTKSIFSEYYNRGTGENRGDIYHYKDLYSAETILESALIKSVDVVVFLRHEHELYRTPELIPTHKQVLEAKKNILLAQIKHYLVTSGGVEYEHRDSENVYSFDRLASVYTVGKMKSDAWQETSMRMIPLLASDEHLYHRYKCMDRALGRLHANPEFRYGDIVRIRVSHALKKKDIWRGEPRNGGEDQLRLPLSLFGNDDRGERLNYKYDNVNSADSCGVEDEYLAIVINDNRTDGYTEVNIARIDEASSESIDKDDDRNITWVPPGEVWSPHRSITRVRVDTDVIVESWRLYSVDVN